MFDCATFAVGNIYECTWTSRGAEPEDFMDVVIVATKEGSGNVAEVIAEDAILFDYTNPDTLLVDTDLIVNSNPVGQDDTLFASPGVFAPFTLVELYSAWPNWPSIPATCGGYTFLKTVVADAAGGLDNVSLGDNLIGSFRARALDAAGISCSRSTIPFDPRKPFNPSGVRLGTPAITTRGMGNDHMKIIAGWIDRVVTAAAADKASESLKGPEMTAAYKSNSAIKKVKEEVKEFCLKFPLFHS